MLIQSLGVQRSFQVPGPIEAEDRNSGFPAVNRPRIMPKSTGAIP